MLPGLDPLHRRLLADAIERAERKRRFKRDAPLMHISRNLLDRLGKQPGPAASRLTTHEIHWRLERRKSTQHGSDDE
jgi:hypothetical protein